jgi:hypothetical protein
MKGCLLMKSYILNVIAVSLIASLGALPSMAIETFSNMKPMSGDVDMGGNRLINIGNVGIGTTSPAAALEVSSSGAMKVGDAFVSGGGNTGIFSANSYYNGSWVIPDSGRKSGQMQFDATDPSIIYFDQTQTAGAANWVTRVTIASGGNVGIGTTSPAAALEVSSSGAMKVGDAFVSGGGNTGIFSANSYYNGSWVIPDSGRKSGQMQFDTTDPSIIYFDQTQTAGAADWVTRVTIASGGNVGIGTTTPQVNLDVNGVARLAKNSAAPFSCDSTHDGAIALTHVYTLCICNGGTPAWVQSADGTTSCSW